MTNTALKLTFGVLAVLQSLPSCYAQPATTVVEILSTLSSPEATPVPEVPQSPDFQYEDDAAFQDAVLNSTNTFRHQHNVPALEWNESLAQTASDWANDCNWKHSDSGFGENLAAGYSNVTAAVEGWGNERKDYNFRNGDFSMSTGHFTQLVWADTVSVGCGRRDCPDDDGEGKATGWFFVCNYFPPGNFADAYDENVPEQENSDTSPAGTPAEDANTETPTDSAGKVDTVKESRAMYALLAAMMAAQHNAL